MMKSAVIGLAAAALLNSASAAGHGHHGLGHAVFHEKRDSSLSTSAAPADGECVVVWTTWYGEASLITEPAPSTTSVSTTSTPVLSSSTSISTPSTSVPSPSTSISAAPSPSVSPQIHVGVTNSGSNASGQANALNKAVSSNGAMGMTYSPYTGTSSSDSSCKSTDQINSDIQAIHAAGFNLVRIYATDCNQLEAVHQATQSLSMSMIIGVFFNSAGSAQSDFVDQMGSITSYFESQGGYSGIDLVIIGNECISSGICSAGQLSSFLAQARSSLAGSGYQGPVSTSLILKDWLDNPSLCPDVDVLASNIHPFFSDNTVSPNGSGDYVDSQIQLVQKACGNDGKAVVVTESGWPTQGPANNGMTPSESNQQAAIGSLRASNNAKAIMFFANDNDLWKAGPAVKEYELYFGCLGQFGQ